MLLLASNLVLAYPMTALFGYPGPALSSVIAVVPAFWYVLWRIGAIFGGGIRDALPWRYYAEVLVVAGVLALAVWFGVDFLPWKPAARLIAACVTYVVLFVPIGLALRLIHREDLHYLWQWLTLGMLKK
jgi:hypothetical protein